MVTITVTGTARQGLDWGVSVDETRILAMGADEPRNWWTGWRSRQPEARMTLLWATLGGDLWHAACDSKDDAGMLRDTMLANGLHPKTVRVQRLSAALASVKNRQEASNG